MASKEASLLLRIKTAGAEALEGVRSAIESIGEYAVEAFTAISGLLVKSIAEYQQQEQAVNSLNRALVNSGLYSKEVSDAYIKQSEALAQLTLFGDDQILQAQSQFSMQARGIQLTQEQTRAILDFAQAQGIDAAQAAEVVGKSVGTATNALSRYGIEVNKNATEAQKLDQVMAGLNAKFGGQASAATQGLGSITQLNKAVGELFESIGAKLAPQVSYLAKVLTDVTTNIGSSTPTLDAFANAFNFIAKAAMGVSFVVQSVSTLIAGALGNAAAVIEMVLEGKFSQAYDAATSRSQDFYTELGSLADQYAEKMRGLDEADKVAQEQKLQQDLTMQREALAQKAIVAQEARDAARILELEQSIKEQEEDIALIGAKEAQKNEVLLQSAQKRVQDAQTEKDKIAALNDVHRLNEEKKEIKLAEFRKKQNELSLQGYSQFAGGLAALSNSSTKELAAIGKAGAISKATIDAYLAIQNALANVPFPANIAAAAGIGVSAFANVSKIAGVQLAEGGIVQPRPGGIQATIGEAGQAEAVIPLDRAGEFGLGGGGGNTINFYGPVMGDESQAREFAKAVDKELLKLRRNNESVSFDSGVI